MSSAWFLAECIPTPRRDRIRLAALRAAKRGLDLVAAALLLAVLLPLLIAIGMLIRLDSPGPSLFRCERVGYRGRALRMLKFRKMVRDAAGAPLTKADDERFTRIGAWLARYKLDELPQLWHVLQGAMSLVGPRPESPEFTRRYADSYYSEILTVKPGMIGLSQLAFADESRVLDPDEPMRHYVERILPQKIRLDRMYAERLSIWLDLRILFWTFVAVVLRRPVAVHRESLLITRRHRRRSEQVKSNGTRPRNPLTGRHAVILAGGKGTRLAPYTTVLPKPLLPIGDAPILDVVIRQLAGYGFSNITLAVGYLAHLIEAVCQDGSRHGVSLSYHHEDEPLGTVGPLASMDDLDGTFLMMNGDVLTTLDYGALYSAHVDAGNLLTVASHVRTVRSDYGVLELDGQNGAVRRVTGFREKPEIDHSVSMGVYIVDSRVRDYIPAGQAFDLPELVWRLLEEGQPVGSYAYDGFWLDIGRHEDYAEAVTQYEELKESFLPFSAGAAWNGNGNGNGHSPAPLPVAAAT